MILSYNSCKWCGKVPCEYCNVILLKKCFNRRQPLFWRKEHTFEIIFFIKINLNFIFEKCYISIHRQYTEWHNPERHKPEHIILNGISTNDGIPNETYCSPECDLIPNDIILNDIIPKCGPLPNTCGSLVHYLTYGAHYLTNADLYLTYGAHYLTHAAHYQTHAAHEPIA